MSMSNYEESELKRGSLEPASKSKGKKKYESGNNSHGYLQVEGSRDLERKRFQELNELV